MSNSSEETARILNALAQESRILADEIARLGEKLSSRAMCGGDQIVLFQSFDALTQQAGIQSMLIALVAQSAVPDKLEAAITDIPLPAMRYRLLDALNRNSKEELSAVPDGETVIWFSQ